ncbi:threonine/serine dehydratase [Legionella micdadei]|uniref:Threonine ammonia-lyase n=1 Tax=Legionella micdadei TaxID=451 RepID=A0A098GG21_LEGMI|nr:threonine/serine dehydratase [Legionella micdadei]ARG97513.1 serine/threonine dehydratase [Legionella micdadei]ARH00177.1 serine/threonine dehydratase [Legionella micdadei]KTD27579.1 L-threonine dehydratase catabolic TdcB [Legionella micdadei]NSL17039.1 threonine/serine dehydratase [Legionella micdadei]CEG60930.1 Threonine ammonia-lyase [Legionella micdadei]
MLDFKKEVLAAESRIRQYTRETPLDYSIALSRETRSNVFLKCENLQVTGSFKVRGAINKLLSLSPAQREQGVVTASSGNHGAAVAFGLNRLKIKGVVFVPENVSPTKVENIRNYTQNLQFYGKDCVQTELHALNYAKQHDMVYLSPYNDLKVIGGQGTVGLELMRQLDVIDVVFVPIGGGGLISGIAWYLKSINSNIKIIGCLPENSPVMSESIKAGCVIERETLPTLSDATAGGIESGSITFDLCDQFVDDYVLVSEEEIKRAIISLINTQHLLVEGAAGVALGAFLKTAKSKYSKHFYGANIVVVLSGANISLETLKLVLVP